MVSGLAPRGIVGHGRRPDGCGLEGDRPGGADDLALHAGDALGAVGPDSRCPGTIAPVGHARAQRPHLCRPPGQRDGGTGSPARSVPAARPEGTDSGTRSACGWHWRPAPARAARPRPCWRPQVGLCGQDRAAQPIVKGDAASCSGSTSISAISMAWISGVRQGQDERGDGAGQERDGVEHHQGDRSRQPAGDDQGQYAVLERAPGRSQIPGWRARAGTAPGRAASPGGRSSRTRHARRPASGRPSAGRAPARRSTAPGQRGGEAHQRIEPEEQAVGGQASSALARPQQQIEEQQQKDGLAEASRAAPPDIAGSTFLG